MKILGILFLICIHLAIQPLRDIHTEFLQAHQLLSDERFDEALKIYKELLYIMPTNSELLCNIGFIYKKKQMITHALHYYEKARITTDNKPKVERAISSAYLALGDFEKGWPAYEYRWHTPPYYNQELKSHIDADLSLHNKVVLIKTEYGLGDTLQFIRYARIMKQKGAFVIVESQNALIPLLKLCPYIDKIIPAGQPEGSHFTILLMSLPLICNTRLDSIPDSTPYLWADKHLIDQWSPVINALKKYNVGICWQADIHAHAQEETVKVDSMAKSINLTYLAQLSSLPNIQLYSLQKIYGTEQLAQLPNKNMITTFENIDEAHGAFMDTAAIIMNMDLVITIDTSIAHLAGGLGKPVWLLLPYAADWRWLLNRNDSPWYPNMRLFRQKEPGNWQGVIDEIKMLMKKKDLETT